MSMRIIARHTSGRTVLPARRVVASRTFPRFQSTSSTNETTSRVSSHLAAGLAGGGVVLAGVYTWYHFSGAKTAVDASRAATTYLQQTKDAIASSALKSQNDALNYLRTFAHSNVSIIPGARPHVDAVFNTLDSLQDKHGDDVNRIVGEGYEEVRTVISEASGLDAAVAVKILEVLRRRSAELEELGRRAGKDAFGELNEKYPQLAEKLGSGYEEFKRLSKSVGPDAKKVFDETTKEMQATFSKGFSQEGVEKVQRLIQSKSSELRERARASAQDAWNSALKDASPYLEQLPEIKQLLTDNADRFISAGAATLAGGRVDMQGLFARIKDAAQGHAEKDKEKMRELREFVQSQTRDAQEGGTRSLEQGWESLQEWVRSMPGGEDALQRMPDLKVLVKVSQDHRDEAKKLARETYEDILRVLEDKSKKAKRLGEDVKEDTKRSS